MKGCATTMSIQLVQDKQNQKMMTNDQNSFSTRINDIDDETKISTTSLIPSLNYFILRQSGRDKLSKVETNTKSGTEAQKNKCKTDGLKRAISEPNLVMDRTDCFCSINRKYKNFKIIKKRFIVFLSRLSIIKFFKYLFTSSYCGQADETKPKSRKKLLLGRSISLDWIDKRTFCIYKISHQLSKKSKLKNKYENEKIKHKNSVLNSSSIKSIGSFLESENGLLNTPINSRSHSCSAAYSTNISLKESLANLNRIKQHDILEEAILNLNLNEIRDVKKSFKKSESKRSFFGFKSGYYGSKSKRDNESCSSINEKIDLRDYVDKKSEINDNVLHRFLESKLAQTRRFAICARIDKLFNNKELINFMEFLLREDYIQNFLM